MFPELYVAGKFRANAEAKKKNCLDCDYYKSIKREFGASVIVGRFNKYIDNNVLKKELLKIRLGCKE